VIEQTIMDVVFKELCRQVQCTCAQLLTRTKRARCNMRPSTQTWPFRPRCARGGRGPAPCQRGPVPCQPFRPRCARGGRGPAPCVCPSRALRHTRQLRHRTALRRMVR
jgi:hypothetical protein